MIQLPDLKDVARGTLSAEQATACEEALTRHYGEPVRPVSRYCAAFESWGRALSKRKERVEALSEDAPGKVQETEDPLTGLADYVGQLSLAIRKSNLLYRLIYEGQPLRVEPCPVHKGRWSGCVWNEYCECMDGSDVTGWLPNHTLHPADLIARFAKSRGGMAYFSHHYPASPDYDEAEPVVATALGKTARGKNYDEAADRLAALLAGDGFVSEEWQP